MPPVLGGTSAGRDGEVQTVPATSDRPSRGRLPLDDRAVRTPHTGDIGPAPVTLPGRWMSSSPRSQPSLDLGLPAAEEVLEWKVFPLS